MATQPIEDMGVLLLDTTTLAPSLNLPDRVMEGTPTCSFCGALDFRFYERANRMRILVVEKVEWPPDLTMEVLAVVDGKVRRFTPASRHLDDLLRLESADWFLPSGVTAPDKVAVLMTYSERGGETVLSSVPVEISEVALRG